MLFLKRTCAIVLSAAFAITAAHAETMADKAVEAQELLDAGDAAAAFAKLDEAYDLAWTAAPLTIKEARFVTQATGYGLYVDRPQGDVFKPGENLLLYVEPVGFGYGQDSIGNRVIGMQIDFVLRSSWGRKIFERDNFMNVNFPTRYKNRELFLDLDINLTGLEPGNYSMELLVRDQHSDKTAEITKRFTIEE